MKKNVQWRLSNAISKTIRKTDAMKGVEYEGRGHGPAAPFSLARFWLQFQRGKNKKRHRVPTPAVLQKLHHACLPISAPLRMQ